MQPATTAPAPVAARLADDGSTIDDLARAIFNVALTAWTATET